MSPQYGELRPTNGWDRLASLGTPANFNGFRILEALPHGTLVVGVSQTLQRWTEGATYIRQGGHHVGQIWSLLALQVRCDALNQVKLDAYRAHHCYTRPCQIYCWLLKGVHEPQVFKIWSNFRLFGIARRHDALIKMKRQRTYTVSQLKRGHIQIHLDTAQLDRNIYHIHQLLFT